MSDNLASPRVVARLIREHGLEIKRRLGQNFLVDGNVADRIVAALDPSPDDAVLEIGPGLGVLTQRLLERAGTVVAVEIDADLVAVLERVLGPHPRLKLVRGDARKVNWAPLLAEARVRKAVGNLPYYATTPLVFRLLESEPPFATIVLMVQREVAERMAADPGGKDYGALSVNVQYRCRVETILHVPPAAFFPRPDVHSTVVRLTARSGPLPVPPARLAQTVRAAFSRRRKTLRNALRSAYPPDAVNAALAAADIDGQRRPETLSVAEFARLAAVLPLAEEFPEPAS